MAAGYLLYQVQCQRCRLRILMPLIQLHNGPTRLHLCCHVACISVPFTRSPIKSRTVWNCPNLTREYEDDLLLCAKATNMEEECIQISSATRRSIMLMSWGCWLEVKDKLGTGGAEG